MTAVVAAILGLIGWNWLAADTSEPPPSTRRRPTPITTPTHSTGCAQKASTATSTESASQDSEARPTLDVYAQSVAAMGEAAAAMGARFLNPARREGHAMESGSDGQAE